MRVVQIRGNTIPLAYPEPKGVAWEKEIYSIFWGERAQGNAPEEPWDGPVKVRLDLYLPIPSGKRKRWREWAISDGHVPATSKPDGDNVAKLVIDALNAKEKKNSKGEKVLIQTGAWKDDAQITECLTRKFYSDVPRVEVELEFCETPGPSGDGPKVKQPTLFQTEDESDGRDKTRRKEKTGKPKAKGKGRKRGSEEAKTDGEMEHRGAQRGQRDVSALQHDPKGLRGSGAASGESRASLQTEGDSQARPHDAGDDERREREAKRAGLRRPRRKNGRRCDT